MMPLNLEISDMSGKTLVSLRRGWCFWLSEISILDENGRDMAKIKQKFKFVNSEFNILDIRGSQIGTILGDWKAWNFTITDNRNAEIGVITKKWAGAAKELFTTADKYVVSIKPETTDNVKRKAIIAAAVVVDMIMKEN
jgi:uncharacterized protein YxjI